MDSQAISVFNVRKKSFLYYFTFTMSLCIYFETWSLFSVHKNKSRKLQISKYLPPLHKPTLTGSSLYSVQFTLYHLTLNTVQLLLMNLVDFFLNKENRLIFDLMRLKFCENLLEFNFRGLGLLQTVMKIFCKYLQ